MSPTTSPPDWVTLGQATTTGQALPLGVDDPVVAARAARRALAAAGRRAIDVSVLSVAAYEEIPGGVLTRFARRALGARATPILVAGPVDPTAGADELAWHAAASLAATSLVAGAVGLAIGLDAAGTTVVRVVRRRSAAL